MRGTRVPIAIEKTPGTQLLPPTLSSEISEPDRLFVASSISGSKDNAFDQRVGVESRAHGSASPRTNLALPDAQAPPPLASSLFLFSSESPDHPLSRSYRNQG